MVGFREFWRKKKKKENRWGQKYLLPWPLCGRQRSIRRHSYERDRSYRMLVVHYVFANFYLRLPHMTSHASGCGRIATPSSMICCFCIFWSMMPYDRVIRAQVLAKNVIERSGLLLCFLSKVHTTTHMSGNARMIRRRTLCCLWCCLLLEPPGFHTTSHMTTMVAH